MKNYEDMDSVEKENIKKHIQMTQTFLSILSGKEFNAETLSLMKSNFEMMRISLEDLGVHFDDKERIRKLNERIRVMEDDRSSNEISNGKVASHIKGLKNAIYEALNNAGISGSCTVSFSPDITVEVQLFTVSKKGFSLFSKNEEEKKAADDKEFALYKKCQETFTTEKDGESLIIVYNDENIFKIQQIVESVIGSFCSHKTFETSTRYIKDETNKYPRYQTPALKQLSFTFLALESSKNLAEAFKQYR